MREIAPNSLYILIIFQVNRCSPSDIRPRSCLSGDYRYFQIQSSTEMSSMNSAYVHGYDQRESRRLQDQATTLVELLHSDTSYPAGSRVLEAGCGVGAQTITLAQNSPHAEITSVDVSRASVAEAGKKVAASGLANVRVLQADIFDLPFEPGSFDHVFVCFSTLFWKQEGWLPRPVTSRTGGLSLSRIKISGKSYREPPEASHL